MPKKDFTAQAKNPDVYAAVIGSKQAQQAQQTHETEKAHKADKAKSYRFNLNMPLKYKDYLQEIAWRNRVTITEYICRLIEEDAERNQNVFQEVNQQNT